MARRIPEERLKLVEELLALHWSHRQIVDHVAQQFSCSTRQVWTYLKKVYERLQAEDARARPMRKHQMRRSIHRFYQTALEEKQYGPALSALDRLCRIDGLFAPDAVSVEHRSTTGVSIDSMTTNERRQEIERLLELRRDMIDGHETALSDKDGYGPN